jgi:hypothetical protein
MLLTMFTPEQKKTIAETLAAKGLKPCPICGLSHTWILGEALVMFPLMIKPSKGNVAWVPNGQSYPSVPVLCSNCGNTVFHNIFTLGLGQLLELTATLEPQPQVVPNG